jgi:hypothetical protein
MAAAVLAGTAGLPIHSLLEQDLADSLGDRALVREIASRAPEMVAFSLYCWNSERSSYIAERLREALPDAVIVGGGPETTADNGWMIRLGAFDLLLQGEGESSMERLLSLSGPCRSKGGRRTELVRASTAGGPSSWVEPYSAGFLDASTGDPVLVETVRGCSSSCSYCAYRRSHPHPRIIPAADAVRILRALKDAGASEAVFLDPTFNARPDLPLLLEGLAGLDLRCFGEVRGEWITPGLAARFAAAGFESVEIGLQSMDPEVLRGSGRGGAPEDVLRGAAMLRDAGVKPVIDLILGLPGDTPAGAVRTASALRGAGLHESVQVFYLALLPGTEASLMNAPGRMLLPPYYSFDGADMGGYATAREEMADILGYDLDLAPRPLVFDGWPGTEVIDPALPGSFPEPSGRPSFRHGVLVFSTDDPWRHREAVLALTRERLALDPFCVLDVILRTGRSFPLDLLNDLRELDDGESYTGRTMRAMNRDGRLRLSILTGGWRRMERMWLWKAAAECSLVLDADTAGQMPEHLWDAGAMARLPGNDIDVRDLASRVPSVHQVLFRSERMERLWSAEILDL